MARPPTGAQRMVLQKVYVDEDKWARVQNAARAQGASASELVRQALERVLCVAEVQQCTIEKVLARPERKP
jgi:hypothetical protein